MLIEKYGADKKAKNDHGQVALELVYELTPEWSKMFAEVGRIRKVVPTPLLPVLRVQTYARC